MQEKQRGQQQQQGFRIIGCMNPGSDVGKKELPSNIKNKFTELYIQEMREYNDLYMLVSKKLGRIQGLNTKVAAYAIEDLSENIVRFYLQVKEKSSAYLLEGAAHISLRNLARSLTYVAANYSLYGYRAFYDGLYLGFGTGLTLASRKVFEE